MSDARRGLSLLSNYSQHAVKGGCIKIVEQHCAIILHVLRETSFQARINSAYCPKRFFTALPSFAAVFRFVVHIANSLMGIAPRCFCTAVHSGSVRNRTALSGMLQLCCSCKVWWTARGAYCSSGRWPVTLN